MTHLKVTRRGTEEASRRYENAMTAQSKLGSVDSLMKQTKISAEYDTWSWYYTELSALRGECSRLGLLVRVNDRNSATFLTMYNAHVISYLNMLSPLMPEKLWEIIESCWCELTDKIDKYKQQIAAVGWRPIDEQLIREQDKLYRTALRIAQRLGLGFKTTLTESDASAIGKAILGE